MRKSRISVIVAEDHPVVVFDLARGLRRRVVRDEPLDDRTDRERERRRSHY